MTTRRVAYPTTTGTAALQESFPTGAQGPRRKLLELFQQALAAVNGRTCVHAWLRSHPPVRDFHLVALGKAADAMTAGALDAAGDRLRAGLLVTRYGYLDTPVYRDPRIVTLEAGHPLPDGQSLAAGQALLLFLRNAPADTEFLFLVSGGTSSLVEAPVQGVTLEALRALNRWLLGSGLPIGIVNRVRTAASRIKGGRLIPFLEGRSATLLAISDVPGDSPAEIGSGLLIPSSPGPLPPMPEALAALPFERHAAAPAGNVETHVIASNALLQQAVAQAAGASDKVHVHGAFPEQDALACGHWIAQRLLDAEPGIHVWGGETVVKLPAESGRGGRNQSLALAAASVLKGRDEVFLLAAGTDGADGNTEDAGALVDGGTVARGEADGYDALDCLARADAGTFLEASGDLVQTGPTGTNVMDVVIGYRA